MLPSPYDMTLVPILAKKKRHAPLYIYRYMDDRRDTTDTKTSRLYVSACTHKEYILHLTRLSCLLLLLQYG